MGGEWSSLISNILVTIYCHWESYLNLVIVAIFLDVYNVVFGINHEFFQLQAMNELKMTFVKVPNCETDGYMSTS